MASQLSVTFTGLRFENPFLLASAPPTESDANIMRAFEAGWGGVVTKTIGLHPVTNVAGPKTKFLRATPDSAAAVDAEAAGHRAPFVVELGAHLGQTARLVDPAHLANQAGASGPHPGGVDHGRIGQRPGAGEVADAGHGLSGRRGGCAGAEPVLPAHGQKGHGLQYRQGHRAHLDRRAGRQGSGARAGLGQAHPVDDRHRRRSARRVPRRRRRHHLVQHLSLAAAVRSADPRIRSQRRRPGLVGRPWRSGDPAALARENVAAHRRHFPRTRSRASEALPISLRR